MPKFLRREVVLGVDQRGPFLRHGVHSPVHRLEFREAIALAFFGQFGDFERVIDHLAVLGDNDAAVAIARSVLLRWSAFLGDGTPRTIPENWFATLNAPALLGFRRSREAAPAAISWVVTLTCNRRCPYCYYKVLPWDGDVGLRPADASLAWEQVARIIDEMAELGTSALYLTGGEPLLRPDLPRIVQRAACRGIRVFLNTKYAIDRELAKSLDVNGLCKVNYSLDAASAKLADGLAGYQGFHREAVATISNLVAVGVPMQVNAVATTPSSGQLRSLVELCVSLGVPELTISPYMEPSLVGSAHTKLIRFGSPLSEVTARLQGIFGKSIKLNVGSAEAAASGGPVDCTDRLLCEVGIQTLDMLPDGRITRCRYSPNDEDLIIGDARTQSLLEIWNGQPLLDLTFPKAEQFGNTACGACGALNKCNSRGRCVVSAKTNYGRSCAPDAACSLVPA